MKIMVTSWFKDVTNYQNVYADNQLVNFYRYVVMTDILSCDQVIMFSLYKCLCKTDG